MRGKWQWLQARILLQMLPQCLKSRELSLRTRQIILGKDSIANKHNRRIPRDHLTWWEGRSVQSFWLAKVPRPHPGWRNHFSKRKVELSADFFHDIWSRELCTAIKKHAGHLLHKLPQWDEELSRASTTVAIEVEESFAFAPVPHGTLKILQLLDQPMLIAEAPVPLHPISPWMENVEWVCKATRVITHRKLAGRETGWCDKKSFDGSHQLDSRDDWRQG